LIISRELHVGNETTLFTNEHYSIINSRESLLLLLCLRKVSIRFLCEFTVENDFA